MSRGESNNAKSLNQLGIHDISSDAKRGQRTNGEIDQGIIIRAHMSGVATAGERP